MSDIAEKILSDISRLSAFEPREDEIGDLENAYRIQREVNDAFLASKPGRRVVGYKIAFNRQSSMDYYRLTEPCYAPLFSDQVYESGVSLKLSDFRDLVIEPEVGVRTGISGSIETLFPAIEIMDARGAFARDPSAAAAVAQRVHSEGAVVGGDVSPVGFDPTTTVARLTIDGINVGEAKGAGPQTPVEAVSWLAARLAKDGLPLDAGMIVLTGAHLPGRQVARTGLIEIDLAPLGSVSLKLI
jgi:2-keto-4-pentenoate hydratase